MISALTGRSIIEVAVAKRTLIVSLTASTTTPLKIWTRRFLSLDVPSDDALFFEDAELEEARKKAVWGVLDCTRPLEVELAEEALPIDEDGITSCVDVKAETA